MVDVSIEHASPEMLLRPITNEAGGVPEDAFGRCIGRLKEIVEAETEILREGKGVDFDVLNQRKTHALLEFMQVYRTTAPLGASHAADRIKDLQRLLAENAELLERRLQATREITDLIVRHIRESDSDGTYSIRSPRVKTK